MRRSSNIWVTWCETVITLFLFLFCITVTCSAYTLFLTHVCYTLKVCNVKMGPWWQKLVAWAIDSYEHFYVWDSPYFIWLISMKDFWWWLLASLGDYFSYLPDMHYVFGCSLLETEYARFWRLFHWWLRVRYRCIVTQRKGKGEGWWWWRWSEDAWIRQWRWMEAETQNTTSSCWEKVCFGVIEFSLMLLALFCVLCYWQSLLQIVTYYSVRSLISSCT